MSNFPVILLKTHDTRIRVDCPGAGSRSVHGHGHGHGECGFFKLDSIIFKVRANFLHLTCVQTMI